LLNAQRAEQQTASTQNPSAVVEINRPLQTFGPPKYQPSLEPAAHVYVHGGDSANEIQRRIDLAIG
jgi:hypothetical protein